MSSTTRIGAANTRPKLSASDARVRRTAPERVRPSTGSVGDAYDNAMAEAFFATLECELLDRRRFSSQAEARMAAFAFIEGFHNSTRRHSALGYLSPIEYAANAMAENN